MKIVILAAGLGTRLADIFPKPLISLKGEETILDFQIKNLSKYVSPHDIYIVVGYKKELIMEKYPDLVYIYNHSYAQTNTGKSLLMALRKIDDDVIWLNGDVYFDPQLIGKLVKSRISAVLVQSKKCGEEEIKYNLDKKGYIKDISKEVVDASGEAVGINLIRKAQVEKFIKHLEKIKPKDYFEKGLENMIKKDKVKIVPVDIGKRFCMEIDFPEDLEAVKKQISLEYKSGKRR